MHIGNGIQIFFVFIDRSPQEIIHLGIAVDIIGINFIHARVFRRLSCKEIVFHDNRITCPHKIKQRFPFLRRNINAVIPLAVSGRNIAFGAVYNTIHLPVVINGVTDSVFSLMVQPLTVKTDKDHLVPVVNVALAAGKLRHRKGIHNNINHL